MGTLANKVINMIDSSSSSLFGQVQPYQPVAPPVLPAQDNSALNAAMSELAQYKANTAEGVAAAKEANNSTLRNAVKNTINTSLNSLTNRRMLRGDVATDTMASSLAQVLNTAAVANSLAEAEGIKANSQIAGMYGNLANTQANSYNTNVNAALNQYNTASNANINAYTAYNNATSQALQNRLEPYKLLLNILETDMYKYAE
jgi:paraquat-inducible protein B